MNEKKQLSKEEIKKLFDFVTSKYVRYEDLKYELVDHLASAIEDIQVEHPNKSFDAALKETYSKFPITGFTNFVAEKHKALTRHWNRQVLNYVIQFFKLPKIILLLSLITVIWFLFQYIPHWQVLIFCYLIMIIDIIICIRGIFIKRKIANKYLFLNTYNSFSIVNLYLVTFIPLQFSSGITFNYADLVLSPFMILIVSSFMAISIIISYFVMYILPEKLKEEVRTKYKHLNIKLA